MWKKTFIYCVKPFYQKHDNNDTQSNKQTNKCFQSDMYVWGMWYSTAFCIDLNFLDGL